MLPGIPAVPRTPHRQTSAAAISPEPVGAHPIVRKAHFPADITAQIFSWGNPEGHVVNIELDLAGIMIHHACMAERFYIREQIVLSQTDNTKGLWW